MKYLLEYKYLAIFSFSLLVSVVSLIVGINKLQPFLFQHIFTSCTAVYDSITTNSLVISTLFVLGLLGLLVSLSVKLVLSSYKTSQSLASIAEKAQKQIPKKLQKIYTKLGITKGNIVVINHTKPVAITAGLLSPQIILSKGLIKILNDQELEAVVLHELYHQQRKHGLLYVIAEAISTALLMLLPVLKDVSENMKQDFEVLADQFAISYQGSPVFVASALQKLSGKSLIAEMPAFVNSFDVRTGASMPAHHFSTSKVIISTLMVMGLSFFALMPFTTAQSIAQAQQVEQCSDARMCSNLCVNNVPIGMSKMQNSSSILPASVF